MIKLKKLTLNNFMCVEHADLNFDDGVTLIVGSNGQGKSTVLQAVTLCLLEEKRSDSYKEFIMLGKDTASLSLDAEISGLPIKINISLNQKSSGMDRNATYNGRVYKNSEVSDLLESFDLKYYADIIMSMQNEGDITKLKPAEREAYLQKLFQFDFTERVDKLKETLTTIKESIDYQNAQIDFNTKSIEDREKEIRETVALTFTDADIDSVNDQIKNLTTEISTLTEQLKEKDTLTREKTATQGVVYSTQQSIDKIKHDIELINSNQGMIDTLNAKIIEYDKANETLVSEKESISSSIIELNNKLDVANQDKAVLSDDINKMMEQHNTLSSELNSLNLEVANKNAEVNHAQKHMDMIKLGTCPECGHAFDRTDQSKYTQNLELATKAKEEAEALRNAKHTESSTVDANIKACREKLRDKEIEISNIFKDISTADYKIKNIDNQIATNESGKVRITAQIKQYSEKMADITGLEAQVVEQQKVLDKMTEDVKILDSKLEKMYNLSELYTSKQTELTNLQQKLSEFNNEVTQNNVILQNNENIRKSIEDMKSKIEESKTSVENYRRQKSTYDEAIVLLDKTFPAWLILKTCQMLEQEMNNFIQVVFPQMAVKLFQNKRGVEFFYTTNINDGRVQTKENLLNAKMASGFEKAILSIAFKVALCRAYNLRFAFMDEIDQAGTEENSEALFRAILSNDLFDQLFVISHKPTVRDAIHSFAPSLRTFYVDKGRFSTEEAN